jgi:hypothetical protein
MLPPSKPSPSHLAALASIGPTKEASGSQLKLSEASAAAARRGLPSLGEVERELGRIQSGLDGIWGPWPSELRTTLRLQHKRSLSSSQSHTRRSYSTLSALRTAELYNAMGWASYVLTQAAITSVTLGALKRHGAIV